MKIQGAGIREGENAAEGKREEDRGWKSRGGRKRKEI